MIVLRSPIISPETLFDESGEFSEVFLVSSGEIRGSMYVHVGERD